MYYVCMYVCMYVCIMYVCMYVCVYLCSSFSEFLKILTLLSSPRNVFVCKSCNSWLSDTHISKKLTFYGHSQFSKILNILWIWSSVSVVTVSQIIYIAKRHSSPYHPMFLTKEIITLFFLISVFSVCVVAVCVHIFSISETRDRYSSSFTQTVSLWYLF